MVCTPLPHISHERIWPGQGAPCPWLLLIYKMLIRTYKEDEAKTIAGNKINERHFLHEFEFLASFKKKKPTRKNKEMANKKRATRAKMSSIIADFERQLHKLMKTTRSRRPGQEPREHGEMLEEDSRQSRRPIPSTKS